MAAYRVRQGLELRRPFFSRTLFQNSIQPSGGFMLHFKQRSRNCEEPCFLNSETYTPTASFKHIRHNAHRKPKENKSKKPIKFKYCKRINIMKTRIITITILLFGDIPTLISAYIVL
jgi:hypothetical protein